MSCHLALEGSWLHATDVLRAWLPATWWSYCSSRLLKPDIAPPVRKWATLQPKSSPVTGPVCYGGGLLLTDLVTTSCSRAPWLMTPCTSSILPSPDSGSRSWWQPPLNYLTEYILCSLSYSAIYQCVDTDMSVFLSGRGGLWRTCAIYICCPNITGAPSLWQYIQTYIYTGPQCVLSHTVART